MGIDTQAHDSICNKRWLNIENRCIVTPLLVGRYETEISAFKVNWSNLVRFREISQSGSILHKEAVDSYFKLISSWKVAEIRIFRSK